MHNNCLDFCDALCCALGVGVLPRPRDPRDPRDARDVKEAKRQDASGLGKKKNMVSLFRLVWFDIDGNGSDWFHSIYQGHLLGLRSPPDSMLGTWIPPEKSKWVQWGFPIKDTPK